VIQEYLAPVGALVLVAAYLWCLSYVTATVITWFEKRKK
jgi:hypothetical protein